MTALLVIAVVLVAAAASPWAIDMLTNRSGRVGLARCSTAARELQSQLWIADLHADSLLWNRNLLRRHRRGHVDVPRLISGHVGLQVFTAVSQVPLGLNFSSNAATPDMITALAIVQRWPIPSWFSVRARAHYQARKLHAFADASGGRLVVVKTVEDLETCYAQQARGSPIVAGLLGIEGAQVLEGELSNLDGLFEAGFRLVGLTHFFDTEVAGSAHGRRKHGLTPLGGQVIARMEQLGMIVDLAHASPATIDDVAAMATKPVLVSHTGVAGTCDGPRNLSDAQLETIAATGGLIGITFFEAATCGRDLAAIIRAIRHAVDRVGVDHVALGSDFDGAVRTPFDCAALVALIDALLQAGFSEREVAAIMGENVRRVLMRTLPGRGGGMAVRR